jgi:hypothetical protein
MPPLSYKVYRIGPTRVVISGDTNLHVIELTDRNHLGSCSCFAFQSSFPTVPCVHLRYLSIVMGTPIESRCLPPCKPSAHLAAIQPALAIYLSTPMEPLRPAKRLNHLSL